MNIVSFVLAFAGLVIPPLVIGGIVFGHLGIRAAARGEAEMRGLGIAGLVLNYVFAAGWTLYFTFLILLADALSGFSGIPS